jgi:hypothetical protein
MHTDAHTKHRIEKEHIAILNVRWELLGHHLAWIGMARRACTNLGVEEFGLSGVFILS